MSTQSQPERRETRYPFRLQVTLRSGAETFQLDTSDVSYRGIFLCTESPPNLRELIAIEATLPPDNTPFHSHGMCVFSLTENASSATNTSGTGIQFYAQSENDRGVWERFILHVRESISEEDLELPSSARRRHPRLDVKFEVKFEVKPANISELETLYSRNLSTGGMFLETELNLDIGQALELSILHPLDTSSFTINSTVRRRSLNPIGLGVEFSLLADVERDRFQEFIVEGIEAIVDIKERNQDDDIHIEIDEPAMDFALDEEN